MNKIMSNIPFQPTTLADICEVLIHDYNNVLPTHKEWRDAEGTLRVTLRTYTNATCHFQVRNIIGHSPESRKVPAS